MKKCNEKLPIVWKNSRVSISWLASCCKIVLLRKMNYAYIWNTRVKIYIYLNILFCNLNLCPHMLQPHTSSQWALQLSWSKSPLYVFMPFTRSCLDSCVRLRQHWVPQASGSLCGAARTQFMGVTLRMCTVCTAKPCCSQSELHTPRQKKNSIFGTSEILFFTFPLLGS